jgi:excisionase family DNA binding protein
VVFNGADRMPTAQILATLNAMDEAPWADMGGKPLDSRQLAKRLGETTAATAPERVAAVSAISPLPLRRKQALTCDVATVAHVADLRARGFAPTVARRRSVTRMDTAHLADSIDPTLVLLTVEEAARRLRIGRTLCYRLIGSGELESVPVGRLRRVPADAVNDYVARLRAANRATLAAAPMADAA